MFTPGKAVRDGSAAGRLVFGGQRLTGGIVYHGNFAEPAIFADLPEDHRLFRDELFAPVLAVTPFNDLAGAILLILGFMASVVVFAIAVVLGLALWAYVWWKTRKLRQTLQAQAPGGQVIEGEAIVVEEYDVTTKNVLPTETPRQQPASPN